MCSSLPDRNEPNDTPGDTSLDRYFDFLRRIEERAEIRAEWAEEDDDELPPVV
jgi:hypothetical protein